MDFQLGDIIAYLTTPTRYEVVKVRKFFVVARKVDGTDEVKISQHDEINWSRV